MARALLTDETLFRLAKNRQVLQAIPCLAGLEFSRQVSKGGCSSCRKKRILRQLDPSQTSEAKRCIYQASDEARKLVKSALGVDQLVIYLNQPGLPPRAVL